VVGSFVRSYLDVAGPGSLLPRTRVELECLFDSLLLEKALYELRYEMNNRPDWVRVPIGGILQLLEPGA
jgi:maltose alpha-D-glucosyltransferase/alpha-amylase